MSSMVKPCAIISASVQPSRQEASSSSARTRSGLGGRMGGASSCCPAEKRALGGGQLGVVTAREQVAVAMRHGKWTNFYDRQGRYTGSVIDTSPRR